MSSMKRRKIETAVSNNAPVSAFAARQRLWGGTAQATTPDQSSKEQETESSVQVTPSKPVSSRRKRGQPSAAQVVATILAETPTNSSAGEDAQLQSSSTSIQDAVSLQLETEATKASQRSVLYHSSFRPNQGNHQQKGNGEVVLKVLEGERLVILGSYGLEVSQGELTVAAATLRQGDPVSWVHSPHCHAIPVIRTTKDSVLHVRSNPAAVPLKELEKLNPVFGRLWNEPAADSRTARKGSQISDDTYQIIYTSDDAPKRIILQELNSPAEWNKKIAELASPKQTKSPVVLVCGPKSSGKSTFGKLLANRLITSRSGNQVQSWKKVLVLDIDPGQPEYGPPGVVSLVSVSKPNLAPSFCHPAPTAGHKIVRSHAIAAVTPGLDAERFIDCVGDLFAICIRAESPAPLPMVINTPGWVQGTGLDILTTLIESTDVTEVIYMSQEGPEETVDELKRACLGKKVPFTTLPSQTSEFTSRTALHYRTMQTMSYFHTQPPSADAEQPRWDSTPLSEVPPWRVRYRGEARGILGVICYDYQPPPSLLAESINGMTVALAEVHGAVLETNMTKVQIANYDELLPEHIRSTPEGIPYIDNPTGRPLWPGSCRSIGLALIRGIDVQKGEFQLITPVAADILRKYSSKEGGKRLVMVAGKFDTPSWAYTEDFYRRAYESGQQTANQDVVVADEDTDDDASEGDHEDDIRRDNREYTEVPWVEMLQGDQKRSVGSRVWRVRRDLGKG